MIVHHHRMILRRSDRRRGGDDLLERLHVGNGKDADARRLDDGDGVEILVALPRGPREAVLSYCANPQKSRVGRSGAPIAG